MDKLDAAYWTERYETNNTGWDTNGITTPLKEYFDQLTNKNLKILIPGAGNAYEAGYLWENGFKNTFVLDWSPVPLENFKHKYPGFPNDQLIEGDFFEMMGQFDRIIEQTFFCAFHPKRRVDYAKKIPELLTEEGKLAGLLWNCDFGVDGPPFGGTNEEYLRLFSPYLKIDILEKCYNSIKPREGRESFITMSRKT